MIFETHTLNTPISQYIESIFHFKDFIPDHSIERVVPTGHVFIIFELDDIPRNTFDNVTLKPNGTYTKAWISGMHKNYISISAHQKSEMFVIQFKPFGTFPFFHFPIEELNEKVVLVEEVFGKDFLELREVIQKQETSQEKFLIAEKWLTDRFDNAKTPPEEILAIIKKLQQEPVANFNKIVESYPHTQKHLISQFKKYVGLTPKYYHRILRFNEILQQIQQKETISWSQVAYQCGYADQSHFIKEFKHFSGFNPKEFIKEEFNKDEPNFFPLDREG
ncbi:helix-turn-helix domain-containing protein [Aquimarina sp. 2201CG14-23]|uniref:helix-turn-helix domain-containing protein n=1 Tax=Aquimarina mycalae TaxID=3040073 RepID=UPI002477D27B|nr:AraC family transcriptional regulator [Aquimarina sp. 2201CG14-23]MDH7448181.1 AraC family transcriptional regulator [Aquimarina sp. 2201CG14-23]